MAWWAQQPDGALDKLCTMYRIRRPKTSKTSQARGYAPQKKVFSCGIRHSDDYGKNRRAKYQSPSYLGFFTRYVRALPVPDEKGETLAEALIDEWMAVFGPMEKILCDRGPSLTGAVITNLSEQLGIEHLKVYPMHPQAHSTVKRWKRTLCWDIASTGLSDWDQHGALSCFWCNTGPCEATRMKPLKAMFGVDALKAWGNCRLTAKTKNL